MFRKIMACFICCGVRKYRTAVLICWALGSILALSWLTEETSRALAPPAPDYSFDHFRRSRDAAHYLDIIQLLIEPSSVCLEEVPLLVLVSSAPSHAEHRAAIRDTWGKHQPTYFVIGIDPGPGDHLVDNYVEAKLHSDLIVYDLIDHYQNLTLKTLLMLEWTTRRCSNAGHLFKTDDDVLVNPWLMMKVIEDHRDAALIGYSKNNSDLHRDPYNKWYVPRWLHTTDHVPHYLSGTGYLIKGEYIPRILQQARKTPIINLEDVYLTYLVSKLSLNLDLAHDSRLSPYRPWFDLACIHWSLASAHSFKPDCMRHTWPILQSVANHNESDVCSFHKKYLDSEWLLY